MCPEKEPQYFSKDIIAESDRLHPDENQFLYRDLENYLKLFDGAKNEQVIGETSVQYLFSSMAAKEIREFNPDSKILILLRDPVSLMVSLHKEYYRRTQEDEKDFSKALKLEAERKKGNRVPKHCQAASLLFYSERVKYAEQVARYMEYFDPSHLKVIIYDDYKDDNAGVYRNILEFLGVDPDFVPQMAKRNISGQPRNQKVNTFIMNSKIKKMMQKYLPIPVYSLFKPLGKRVLWEKRGVDTLPAQKKEELKTRYKHEVEKISDLLNTDLVHRWNY